MTWLNGADRHSQDFSRKYPGARINADKIILHTTEGPNWPDYDGGKNAPHITVKVDARTGAWEFRQHFRLDQSSRALKNLPGGVETNTDDTIQVELIGTCDPRVVNGWAKGSVLWPAAEEKHLAGVRTILRAICAATSVPFIDAASRGWKPYPSSYANGAGQRLSNAEWSAARGILGHQHVPENTHGDPGDIPIARLIRSTITRGDADMAYPVRNKKTGGEYVVSHEAITHLVNPKKVELVRNLLTTEDVRPDLDDADFFELCRALGIPWDVLDANGLVLDPESGEHKAGETWSRSREAMARIERALNPKASK